MAFSQKKTVSEYLSPPLLPLSPENLPFIPSPDTGYLNLLSECTSLTSEELKEAEGTIFATDAIVPAKRPANESR